MKYFNKDLELRSEYQQDTCPDVIDGTKIDDPELFKKYEKIL